MIVVEEKKADETSPQQGLQTPGAVDKQVFRSSCNCCVELDKADLVYDCSKVAWLQCYALYLGHM